MDERQTGELPAAPAKYVRCYCCGWRLYDGETLHKGLDSEGQEQVYCSPYCAAGKHSTKEGR